MLQNNLDPEVAERPDELVVYGGIGKAARNWDASTRSCPRCKRLNDDETLLVQSGKPVGVFRTHADAPRVLIANSNLVPHWATWEHFHELDRKGLMMFGQMTAGTWIYIGTQGIVQGTYETFGDCARKHFGRALRPLVLTAGWAAWAARSRSRRRWRASRCSRSSATTRIDNRLRTGYVDRKATTLDQALALIDEARRATKAALGRPARQRRRRPAGARARKVVPDAVTDQTSAHEPLNGYVPRGCDGAGGRGAPEGSRALSSARRARR